ncbi:hypothetical protein BpHYR1_025173, partial [Brachionus plicatilis]
SQIFKGLSIKIIVVIPASTEEIQPFLSSCKKNDIINFVNDLLLTRKNDKIIDEYKNTYI